MCIRDRSEAAHGATFARYWMLTGSLTLDGVKMSKSLGNTCLLYTSDAADERSSVDLGGRRIIKKKTQTDISHSVVDQTTRRYNERHIGQRVPEKITETRRRR